MRRLVIVGAFLVAATACTATESPSSSSAVQPATTASAPTATPPEMTETTEVSTVETTSPVTNLALGRQVSVSASLTDRPAEMAVDGIEAQGQPNWWGAGEFAPQWIEIDLGTPAAVHRIRLTTSQAPEGHTRHLVWGVAEDGTTRLLHEFAGITDDHDLLEYAPPEPWQAVRHIRIETVESPSWVSWREIEIYGTTDVSVAATTTPADIIFYNGPVITMETEIPVAEALAVTGEMIVGVGSTDEVMRHKGPATLMVDLTGRALLPGFIDSHAHWIGDRGIAGLETPQEAIAAALQDGWTSISEQFVSQERLDELVRLDEAGDLLVRVNAYLPVNYHDDYYGVWFAGLTPRYEYSPRLRIAGAKIFVDRANPSLMFLSEPYSDQPGYRGHASWTQEGLTAMVTDLHSDGWQITIHTTGDAAHDLVLNALSAALNGEPNDAFRHRIEHVVVVRDDQIQRMRDLRIIASIQLTWLNSDWLGEEFWGPFEAVLGPDRIAWLGRWQDLLDAGVKVIGGTDTPWSPASAVRALHEAATRVGKNGAPPEPWMLDQRITVEEALRLITIDAAYGTFDEDIKGSLAPGKWADLVVLSHNPLEVGIKDLPGVDVLATIVGGQIVYCAPASLSLCD